MTTDQETPFELTSWLETAFRNEIPPSVERLLNERKVAQNCFEELMTQLPTDVHPVIESLYELQKTETFIQYRVFQELFLRHLERHQVGT